MAAILFGLVIPIPNFSKRTRTICELIFFLLKYWQILRSWVKSSKMKQFFTDSYKVLSRFSDIKLFFIVWCWCWLMVFASRVDFLTPNVSTYFSKVVFSFGGSSKCRLLGPVLTIVFYTWNTSIFISYLYLLFSLICLEIFDRARIYKRQP